MRLLHPRGLWGYSLIAASPRYLYRDAASSSIPTPMMKHLHTGLFRAAITNSSLPASIVQAPYSRTGPWLLSEEREWPRKWVGKGRVWRPLLLKQHRLLLSLRGGERQTREIGFEVSGLSSSSCVTKVQRALLSIDGVLEASFDLATRQVRIITVNNGGPVKSLGVPSSGELAKATEAVGFPARVLWDTAGASTRVVLDIQGLKCGGCVAKGEVALAAVAGVEEASINLSTSTATVTLTNNAGGVQTDTTMANIVAALSSRGYPSKVLRVNSEQGAGGLSTLAGEKRVTPAQRHEREEAESGQRLKLSIGLLAISTLAHVGHYAHHLLPPHGSLLGVAVRNILDWLPEGWFDLIQASIATAALVGPGSNIIRSGLASMWRLSPDMNSLVSTGVLAVYFSSLVALLKPSLGLTATFHEPVMLLGAVLLGRLLEARQRLKAAKGLQGLFDARPEKVRLVDSGGSVKEVATASVRVGDIVEVLPGDRFSVDGVVVNGRTAANESSLTGESIPVPKGPGDAVRAGTLSAVDGSAVRVRVAATGARSVLGTVIALVEDAQARKAPVQRLADQIAGKFTWVVFAASASTFLFWGTFYPSFAAIFDGSPGSGPWSLGARLAVDVCLIACPCSLGLATPTAVMVGTGVAAEHGLLIKGADILEIAKKTTTVVFDKTGTLTTGKPEIIGVISLEEGWDKKRIVQVAAAVETGCRHPLAEAVVFAADKDTPGRSLLDTKGLCTVPGMGANAQVKLGGIDEMHSMIHVGSPRYIEDVLPNTTTYADPVVRRLFFADDIEAFRDDQEASALSREVTRRLLEGQTAIAVAVKGRVVGLLFASDTLRSTASVAINFLTRQGLAVKVASGDRKEAAWAASAAAGVPREDTSWGATPADKASLVRSLQERGDVVMVVGDGINDAPALAAANVGVAMGAGSASAMEAADIVLMQDDVRGAGMAVQISRLTMRKVRSNLMWALGYNIVAIPLAAGAFLPVWGIMLSPALAGVMMSCSSVAVVTNSLLLRRSLERKIRLSSAWDGSG